MVEAMGPPLPSEHVDAIASLVRRGEADGFSGVVRVDVDGGVVHESAHGFADRARRIVNTPATRFAAASVTKGFTALVVARLIEDRALSLDTSARSVLGDDLATVDLAVTVHQLLAHRSGVGEYFHDDGSGPPPAIAPGQTDTPSDIVTLLRDVPMQSVPGAEFCYSNSGYVLLALIAERVTGEHLHDLIERLVLAPARMDHSGVPRYDDLPSDAAIGYLDPVGERTNVKLVPVRGIGDGGLFTTVEDLARFWRALLSGGIVAAETLALMTTAHGHTAGGTPYGLGFWLGRGTDSIELEGADAGISFRSVHQPSRRITWTVASNWTDGAWPIADGLGRILATTGA